MSLIQNTLTCDSTAFETLPFWNEDIDLPDINDDDDEPSEITVYEKELDASLFLIVHMCSEKRLKIFITRNNMWFSTPSGIYMSVFTWYDFCRKIDNLNTVYTSSSFIANNKLTVISLHSKIHISVINKKKSIQLDRKQLQVLKKAIPELNETLINFKFSEYLQHLIIKRGCRTTKAMINEQEMFAYLVTCVEEDLICVFKSVFECYGCKENMINRLTHECLILSNLEKLERLGYEVLMLADIRLIVSKFLHKVKTVTPNFLNSLDVQCFSDVLFNSQQ